jgi:hypothetical protein
MKVYNEVIFIYFTEATEKGPMDEFAPTPTRRFPRAGTLSTTQHFPYVPLAIMLTGILALTPFTRGRLFNDRKRSR